MSMTVIYELDVEHPYAKTIITETFLNETEEE